MLVLCRYGNKFKNYFQTHEIGFTNPGTPARMYRGLPTFSASLIPTHPQPLPAFIFAFRQARKRDPKITDLSSPASELSRKTLRLLTNRLGNTREADVSACPRAHASHCILYILRRCDMTTMKILGLHLYHTPGSIPASNKF